MSACTGVSHRATSTCRLHPAGPRGPSANRYQKFKNYTYTYTNYTNTEWNINIYIHVYVYVYVNVNVNVNVYVYVHVYMVLIHAVLAYFCFLLLAGPAFSPFSCGSIPSVLPPTFRMFSNSLYVVCYLLHGPAETGTNRHRSAQIGTSRSAHV